MNFPETNSKENTQTGNNLSSTLNKENNPSISKHTKRLAVFDFDQTIVNDNTDTVIRSMIDMKKIPATVQALSNDSWTKYMQEIFNLLHQENITEQAIRKKISEIHEIPGMVKFIKTLHKMNFDLIIISDSNSEFINEWNRVHGLQLLFYQIFTNSAKFNKNGLLEIQPYHHQIDCKISAANLCKGQVLQTFILHRLMADNIKYENIIYVGDGTNDICPILKLSKTDYACVRTNYSMDKRLMKNIELQEQIQAKLLKWSTGFEILNEISQIFQFK